MVCKEKGLGKCVWSTTSLGITSNGESIGKAIGKEYLDTYP